VQTLLHRLFHEEDVRLFEPEPVAFRCGCSRERVAGVLVSMGRDEVDAIIDEQGAVEADCEFCNAHYTFDRVDAAALFSAGAMPASPRSTQ
jgi:molecular chaperone Hsp33